MYVCAYIVKFNILFISIKPSPLSNSICCSATSVRLMFSRCIILMSSPTNTYMFHEINISLKFVTQTFENLICLNTNSYKIHEIHSIFVSNIFI